MNDNENRLDESTNKIGYLTESDSSEWVMGLKGSSGSVKGRFVIGEPKGTFYEKLRVAKQTGMSHRSDWIADIAHIGDTLVMGTSMRGPSHYGLRKVRQDAFAIGEENNSGDSKWVIAAIADGVSASPNAHYIADYMVRKAVILIGEKLFGCNSLCDMDWNEISQILVDSSLEFCRAGVKQDSTIDLDKISPRKFASNWATTLEIAVIQASYENASKEREFSHITIAGDGAAYILSKKNGWKTIKHGKVKTGDIASNKVNALPIPPTNVIIKNGHLNKGECLVLSTDGLSDFIGNGDSGLGGFFQEKLPNCNNLASLLQLVDVSHFQMDDDRTVILIKELR